MASPDDDLEYLAPSFDPSSLTVPRLRNILMTHDINYPPSAKKSQLVDLFTQELKPKSRKILAARDRVRRTSRGITDMPSSQEGTVNGDFDDEATSMAPPPTPKLRKPRKSVPVSVKSDIPNERRSSSKHARLSDTETEQDQESKRPAVRKGRRSENVIKSEQPDDPTPIRPPLRSDAFSDENPFQKGSSPLEIAQESGERKRRSAGASSDRTKSRNDRRRTEGTMTTRQVDGVIPPTSKNFELPVKKMKEPTIKVEPGDTVEAGEDFTPEAQLELVRERAARGEQDILPPRRKKKPQAPGKLPKSAPWVVLMALLGGYATWWRQEKSAVGYCGIGRPSNALSNVQLPEWADALQPSCEPCPQHAICYERMETTCEEDFVLQSHPLSLWGLVPLPPTCEPDGEKVRKVKAVADRAVEHLRERKAQAECGSVAQDTGKIVSEELNEQDLKHEVAKKRRRGMADAEFDDLWKGAIGEIKGREEVTSSGDGPYTQLRSTSLARLPLSCALRRSARLTLARYRLSVSLIAFGMLGLLYTRSLIRTSRSDTARIPSLVATTLDRLATQAALYSRGDAGESWISVGQLRDDILRDEFSDKRRESIWKRVSAVVERNANVRASVREGRGGDFSRVWEWIGSVGLLDEPWSGRRSSGGGKRISFGVPDLGTPEGPPVPVGEEKSENRKWDEGRPVY